MKKILLFILVAVFTVNLPSFAVITPEESMSEAYIQNHGHSNEMSRLIDLQNAQVNGIKPAYKSKNPDWYTSNKKVNFIRKAFMYLDNGLDDGNFAKNNINYTNRWDDL